LAREEGSAIAKCGRWSGAAEAAFSLRLTWAQRALASGLIFYQGSQSAELGVGRVACCITWLAQAQTVRPPEATATPEASKRQDDDRGVRLKSLPRDIFEDQGALFTMPLRMGQRQWKLAVPFGVAVAGLIASDTAVEGTLPGLHPRCREPRHSPTRDGHPGWRGRRHVPVGSFAKNEHAREAGFLTGKPPSTPIWIRP